MTGNSYKENVYLGYNSEVQSIMVGSMAAVMVLESLRK